MRTSGCGDEGESPTTAAARERGEADEGDDDCGGLWNGSVAPLRDVVGVNVICGDEHRRSTGQVGVVHAEELEANGASLSNLEVQIEPEPCTLAVGQANEVPSLGTTTHAFEADSDGKGLDDLAVRVANLKQDRDVRVEGDVGILSGGLQVEGDGCGDIVVVNRQLRVFTDRDARRDKLWREDARGSAVGAEGGEDEDEGEDLDGVHGEKS